MPNASAHLLPKAGATQERTLEAVRCSAWLDLFAAIRTETLLNELDECSKSFDHTSGECRLVIRDTVNNFVANPTDCLNFSQLGVRNHSIGP